MTRIAIGAIAAVLVGVVVVAAASKDGDEGRHLTMVVPAATHFFRGLDVRAAGQKVGVVSDTEVTSDDRALLRLRIDDENVWPLPAGTRASVRWGGTIKFIARYVQLHPPRRRVSGTLRDGSRVAAAPIPQEFDQVFAIFDARTRRNLRTMLRAAGGSLGDASDELASALHRAPPAAEQARGVLEDVSSDSGALETLVVSSDRVVNAVRRSNPDVGRLVSGAGTTFRAVANQATALRQTLAAMPEALGSARVTLAHADRTLAAADDVVTDLSPAIPGLKRLGSPLAGLLGGVVDIGPDATRSLRTLRRAGPDLNPFLAKARALMPALESGGRELARQVHCVRPYSPEIAGLASTWAGWWGTVDGKDHYIRAEAGTFPWPNEDPRTPGQLHQQLPQITSAFPRPPGQLVGQPWLLPECGITADALDPNKDPEAGKFDPLSKEPVRIDDRDDEPSKR